MFLQQFPLFLKSKLNVCIHKNAVNESEDYLCCRLICPLLPRLIINFLFFKMAEHSEKSVLPKAQDDRCLVLPAMETYLVYFEKWERNQKDMKI